LPCARAVPLPALASRTATPNAATTRNNTFIRLLLLPVDLTPEGFSAFRLAALGRQIATFDQPLRPPMFSY
jgi:hypothetical protein